MRPETAPRKFKKYFATRRCVLPASGFWVRRDDAQGRVFVRPTAPGMFGLAGLWTEREHDGAVLRSCTILTVEARAKLGEFHDRMPVVLVGADARRWLDAAASEAELLALCDGAAPIEWSAA